MVHTQYIAGLYVTPCTINERLFKISRSMKKFMRNKASITIEQAEMGMRMKEVREPYYTQEEMSAMMDVSVRTIQNYEAGNTEPSTSTLAEWAIACQTTIDYLALGQGSHYLDPATSKSLRSICDRALDLKAPAYGVMCRDALKLDEHQLYFMIDIMKALGEYDVKLNVGGNENS